MVAADVARSLDWRLQSYSASRRRACCACVRVRTPPGSRLPLRALRRARRRFALAGAAPHRAGDESRTCDPQRRYRSSGLIPNPSLGQLTVDRLPTRRPGSQARDGAAVRRRGALDRAPRTWQVPLRDITWIVRDVRRRLTLR